MNHGEATAHIKKAEPAIRALGERAVYLFGSTARNEAMATSDVHIFIDRKPSAKLAPVAVRRC